MTVWRHIANLSVLVSARLGGAVLGLLCQIALTRIFAREDVGLVFLVMSATAILSLLMTAGYPALSVAYLARYHSLARKRLVAAFHAAARKESALASLLILGGVGLALMLLPLPKGIAEAAAYASLAALPYAVIRLNSSGANALRRFSLSYVPDFVFRPMLLLIVIVLFAIAHRQFPVQWVLWAYVIITLGVALYQAFRLGPENVMATSALSGGDRLIMPYRRRAWALMLVAMVTLAFADLVTLIAGWFLPSAEVAVVGLAVRLAALVGFITQASQHFVMRDLTSAMVQGDGAEAETLLRRTNLTTVAAMAAALAAAALLAPFALQIFGAEYRAAYWPLLVFMLGQTLRAGSGMNGHLLSLDGHQVRSAIMCALAVAIMIAASAVLGPVYGAIGIALAACAAELAWAIMLAIFTHKLTGRRGDVLATMRA